MAKKLIPVHQLGGSGHIGCIVRFLVVFAERRYSGRLPEEQAMGDLELLASLEPA